jgi:hypothetical protein
MLSRQLIIYFLLCIIAIVMVREFSFNPESFTGNRNSVILIFPYVLLAFSLFGYELFLKLRDASFNVCTWRKMIICSFIIMLASSVLEFVYFSEFIQKFGRPLTREASRIYIYPWLNQYTNAVFVNFYTFLMYASTVTFCTSLITLVKK